MRRPILFAAVVALALVMLVPPAGAGGPQATHVKIPFDATWVSLVGAEDQLCDFDYRQHAWGWYNLITVGEGPSMEVLAGGVVFVTHENLSDPYVLTERTTYADIYFNETERILEAGLYWHLRGPDGKIVEVEAGRVIYDLDYSVLTYTPNRSMTFAEIICPALGGAPAS
jgi:hypothetical protein